ncbi:PhzF family phenazine biosynthesis protein [Leifsonia sp. fls2-241-R2A-40a]|uniref:PhzF family phenazine biosynthesis protein n=1 Tax=Leifsonia sp. fls2-241-R2A-40a TaxID=3040290 RepID=UPI00254E3BE0|nr:PhzF family phenazine biosynthesis protein [Leifsonia sp. fls2-241-R2A-40a]
MDETIEVVVVRVFTNESGRNGNELGIVRSSEATASREQEIASALGFSETVFLDGVDESTRDAALRIFTPAKELPFAGHPSVGTAWWLSDQHTPVDVLIERAGDVEVTVDDDTAWITARPEWTPEFEWHLLASPADVDALDPFAFPSGQHYAYAWIDEAAGTIRSRMFAPEMGIIEDEATGAAAIALTARLGRDLSISQGEGSELATELLDDGRVRVGGTTVYDRTIEATL